MGHDMVRLAGSLGPWLIGLAAWVWFWWGDGEPEPRRDEELSEMRLQTALLERLANAAEKRSR